MQFIDLTVQQQKIRGEIESRICNVLDHGQYIMGPEIGELEKILADYTGTGHAIACASGTDALLMALMALEVGPGDAVFTTPFTFIATAEVISLLGATPVFVDIDPATFNVDPQNLERAVEAVKSGNSSLHPLPQADCFPLVPRGIIAVDLFGLPADYDSIGSIAKKNKLFTVEDAAQSFGAEFKKRKACSFGDIACTSFFPAKPLGCYGDGGMCFTDRSDFAEKMDSIRNHGKGIHKYENVRIGINGRLDTIQAAVLLEKFRIFPEEVRLRQEVARRYGSMLKSHPSLKGPCIPEGFFSVWAQYSILAESGIHRDAILKRMEKAHIPSAVYYPCPLHLQKAFEGLGYSQGDFPVSEKAAERIFSIPMHPYLAEREQEAIIASLEA